MKKLVVFGGNGFIGSSVCNAALQLGLEVVSVNRSGRPQQANEPWMDRVQWVKWDLSNQDTAGELAGVLQGSDGAVSCIGAFGSNEVSDLSFGEFCD